MFCPKCGSDNEDTFKFCRICGTPLAGHAAAGKKQAQTENAAEEAAAPERPKDAEPVRPRQTRSEGAPVYTSQPGFGGVQSTAKKASVAEQAVKIVRSPLALITILLFTVSIVLEIVSLVAGGANVDTFLSGYSASVNFNFTGAAVVGGIISNIPAILIGIGMWLVYASALRNRPGEISTTGITIIKVITIIEFVLVCIGIALAVLFMVALVGGSAGAFEELFRSMDIRTANLAGAAAIALLVILAAGAVIIILYFVKLLGTLSWTKAQLRNEDSRKSPSLYVAVIIFILAACTLLSLITAAGTISLVGTIGLPSEYSDLLYSIMPGLAGNIIVVLIQAVFYILAGVLILKLRKVKNLEY